MNTSKHNVIASSARGLVCAGISTMITAFFSWTFVASTDTLDWMGSSALKAAEIAMIQDAPASNSVTNLAISILA